MINILFKHAMQMNSGIDQETKNKIIAIISAIIPKTKIYIFGSRAKGTHSQWSDIDLALDSGIKLAMRDIGEITNLLQASSIPYKIDVVDIHNVSEPLKMAIERDKILWKA